MQLFELVLTFCLAANPATCFDVQLDLRKDPLEVSQCIRKSYAFSADFLQKHPDWSIKAIHCGRMRENV